MRSLNNISLGQFIPGDSLIHRLDPRCKIVCTFMLLAGLFMASEPLDFVLWCALPCLFSRLSGTSMTTILKTGRPVVFLVAVTVFINLLWTPGHEILRIGPLRVTWEGITVAVGMGLRLFFLVIFAAMLMMTTSPMDFSAGLERLMSPIGRLGLPTSEMAMMMTIALRFIPTLFEETDRILKAQISRGADFDSGGLIRRARSFVPVLVPLFVLVFLRAENLATAMESRCYSPGAPRTRLHPLRWAARDSVAVICLFSFIAAVVALDRLVLGGVRPFR
ncbi:MAG: energy-coupling factor transporter transmembrane protein EcfT [Synergistaceae bacterium]|jgi:energy-coupling factor transport system permease protein|nr:energy-coupling factor transporter transmembrane protein EcfT [Synergistaceae bacterium]